MPAKDDSWLIPQMLITDGEIALGLVDIPSNHHDPDMVERTIKNARLTYSYIAERRLSVPISADYAEILELKLSALKGVLEQLGESVAAPESTFTDRNSPKASSRIEKRARHL
jgi:hypothetical protein